MIGHFSVKRCVGCLLYATREIVDEFGQRQALCDRCPSPDEIRQRAAEIRAGWDDIDFLCRRHGLTRESIAEGCGVQIVEINAAPGLFPVRRSVVSI
ncbi:MAG: hypothetical protein MUF48_05085 [Pirellulaceae bacterium]|jgi:hypothetical protein|nr:hypothetical protein [Pirellulaceae bacterium]